MRTALAFDDVLLVPQYSAIESRSNVDTKIRFADYTLEFPILAAPMDSVYSDLFARRMYINGGMAIVDRYRSIADRANAVFQHHGHIGVAIGTKESLDELKPVFEQHPAFVCVDVAHGEHAQVEDYVYELKSTYPRLHVMAGNVATPQGFQLLQNAGADSIRVGIGGGSACTTRIVTGHGIPTWQSIRDINVFFPAGSIDRKAQLIADGGLRNSGDIVKALAAGADLVMLGNVLAHAEEAPDGPYRGMASREAQTDWKGSAVTVEGVTVGELPRQPLERILSDLAAGIRSGLSYSGAHNVTELRENAEFIQITTAGMQESRPHGTN